jgi:hypothetical protein
MTFIPEKTDDFLRIFNSSKTLIRNFEGCSHLELLNDVNDPSVFFTYSYWDNDQCLDNYRNSELFAGVWSQTKALFSAKPSAWSLNRHTEVK